MGEKDMEFVKDVEVLVSDIELKTNPQNADEVLKVRFKTDKGDITWKPKVERRKLLKGMKVISDVPMELGELPEKLAKLGIEVGETGGVKMKVSYTKWNTDKDGTATTYRFINSEKIFNGWEKVAVKQEEIIEG